MLQYKSIFGKENYSKGSHPAEMWLATITTFILLCRGAGARATWLQISPFSEEGLSTLRWLPRRKRRSQPQGQIQTLISLRGGNRCIFLFFLHSSLFTKLVSGTVIVFYCSFSVRKRIMYWIGNYRFCLAFHEWLEHKNNLQTQVGVHGYLMPAPNPRYLLSFVIVIVSGKFS